MRYYGGWAQDIVSELHRNLRNDDADAIYGNAYWAIGRGDIMVSALRAIAKMHSGLDAGIAAKIAHNALKEVGDDDGKKWVI